MLTRAKKLLEALIFQTLTSMPQNKALPISSAIASVRSSDFY